MGAPRSVKVVVAVRCMALPNNVDYGLISSLPYFTNTSDSQFYEAKFECLSVKNFAYVHVS